MTEAELEALNFADAPKMVSTAFPGPKAAEALALSARTESMARGGGRMPVVMDRAFGVTFKDPDGNVFVDLSAGVGVSSVGRCHPEVVKTMQQQAGDLMHAMEVNNTRRTELAAKISEIAPEGLRGDCITFFTQSGSDALEAAVKFARRVTGRHQIVAFHGGYHGIWQASNALTTGTAYRKGYGPFMGGVIHAPYPYAYRFPFDTTHKSAEQIAGEYIDYLLNTPYTAADDVAAVIVEPVQGEGGYVPPAPEFLQLLRKACDRSGALLIVDEVQCGAGRTGKMWAVEHSGVKPDMLTFGKGMGGDVPMAGLVMRSDLAAKIPDGSAPNTFAANALSAAVALTNIRLLQDPELNLVQRAHDVGLEAQEYIRGFNSPYVGEVRGRGLMIGIELVEDQATRAPLTGEKLGRLMGYVLSHGVLMVPCGRHTNVMRVMPSLTVPRSLLFKALDVFGRGLASL
ncbi:aspartate aminotransferase family protein [Paracidovorax avenae]|uniref:Diaminobutyrate--2-oxoglutarate transaminase n=1 Tax=Paracidovorax avenae (strain ATCC 19860 / DSM 7227 / CCUG 15838 / JCM 20985 / LMG 2117 / NCPPB 1011) TaxID=643561 RepID=F0Q5L5_PARA1|nr:aspartate aminotransferase family protein [Paracidovorax avenae]ADX45643.1 Acetylornithine transaminase [Paracidovorax avenae ATCC 19860]AVS68087.1 aspartate aminotransferase family protein [Paracidovorax avenae]AVS80899.1 aspartate aminotransferase family protein [Paracidovorax avenae]AVS91437.1 aspartate aminotransferase family protein [Paracidovorax avenae]AVT19973.1 aspartate aminotransferase family protein [Paracidovorax avenae]